MSTKPFASAAGRGSPESAFDFFAVLFGHVLADFCGQIIRNSLKNVDRVIATVGQAADHLAATRPTAVNLFWALDRMQDLLGADDAAGSDLAAALKAEADRILDGEEMDEALRRRLKRDLRRLRDLPPSEDVPAIGAGTAAARSSTSAACCRRDDNGTFT